MRGFYAFLAGFGLMGLAIQADEDYNRAEEAEAENSRLRCGNLRLRMELADAEAANDTLAGDIELVPGKPQGPPPEGDDYDYDDE